MQTGLGLTTNALLGHLSFYLTVRPFTNMPHQCLIEDHCALVNFFILYHCATCNQHAQLVFSWQPVRHQYIFKIILLCAMPPTCPICVFLTIGAPPWHFLKHRTVRYDINMSPPCGLDNHCVIVNILHHQNVRHGTKIPHSCRTDDHCALVKCYKRIHCATFNQHAATMS